MYIISYVLKSLLTHKYFMQHVKPIIDIYNLTFYLTNLSLS